MLALPGKHFFLIDVFKSLFIKLKFEIIQVLDSERIMNI